MFTKTLYRNTEEILDRLGWLKLPPKTYLAGGTGLALQLGHRISVDLDFFTPSKFIPKQIASRLRLSVSLNAEQAIHGTIIGNIGQIRFSLFHYDYPLLVSCKHFLKIKVADIKDIAAMKIAALTGRGTKRDFVDLYFLCQKINLKQILVFYRRKYDVTAKNGLVHIQKSLVYFNDAEVDPMPQMLIPITWENVKRYFEKEVREIWGY
ncbi:MAG: nucleotidyl transferase AbiEii/AbiGii toxin family protein [Planctomycetota bacterium]|nr:nucleotidyl transferase AbiEii/AbiGii toxin family protein [Planctomycetota bacterium]MDI6788146.1 nucleotidyl transferase AbiEii/AbiGii toxin family protein [Planctomycetota bacterium]